MPRKRLYSLFERVPASKEHPSPRGFNWARISELAVPKQDAVRVFQSALLFGAFGGSAVRELRVVQDQNEWDDGVLLMSTLKPPVTLYRADVPYPKSDVDRTVPQ